MITLSFIAHLVVAILWVGGMTFAHFVVRPAAAMLKIPERVALWSRILSRFFVGVWIAVILLPISGYWMVFMGFGGMHYVNWPIHLMQGVAWIMIALFLKVYFGDYQKMKQMISDRLFPEAALYLDRIRRAMTINLSLGWLITIAVAMSRY